MTANEDEQFANVGMFVVLADDELKMGRSGRSAECGGASGSGRVISIEWVLKIGRL